MGNHSDVYYTNRKRYWEYLKRIGVLGKVRKRKKKDKIKKYIMGTTKELLNNLNINKNEY